VESVWKGKNVKGKASCYTDRLKENNVYLTGKLEKPRKNEIIVRTAPAL